ncbi:MAG TPA: hypothetical protein PLJ47_14210 [Candidatus Hydrogenedentes bacterium]|nr:hypothetical protein [Candidatus Hydrogenedentota bacterium]HRK35746.1 hypothetical protein [Candidatus Hydrogenedentota bacterium]
MTVRSRIASLALLAAVALPLAVGCQFLVFKICVKNDTSYYLDEVAIKTAGEPTYPPATIGEVAPGGSDVIGGVSAGAYDVRATFDVADDDVCESVLELTGIEIENTNLCITYDEVSAPAKGDGCTEIYATLDYVI